MWKHKLLIFLCILSPFLLSGCKVGTSSLFIHPKDRGYEYMVTYNVLGGQINQMKTRTVYYAKDSLVFLPSGNSGMLVQPRNGNKTLLGWYTAVEEIEEKNRIYYRFQEEDRWDFDTMRVNDETAPNHNLTLYARWGENPMIRFVEKDTDLKPYLTWIVDIGTVLKRPTSTEPVKAGSTLVDYYTDENYTTKYEFDQIVSEDLIQYDDAGNAYMNVFCKFIEGDYTRIRTVNQLKDINKNPNGNYLLANDLDLGNENWEPFEEFHGIFDGNGYCLKNMKLTAKNRVSGIAAKRASIKGYGLFGEVSEAVICNLTMKDAVIVLDSSSNVAMSVGILAGNVKKSELSNICLMDNQIKADEEMKIDLLVSKLAPCDDATIKKNNEVNGTNLDSITTKGKLVLVDN